MIKYVTTVVAMTLKMGEVSVCRLSSDCGRLWGQCFFDLTVKILTCRHYVEVLCCAFYVGKSQTVRSDRVRLSLIHI